MGGQQHHFRVVVIEQGDLLAQRDGEQRGADGHAHAYANAGPGRDLRIQRGALTEAITDANGHRGSKRQRQNEHQRAEVKGDLVPGYIHNPQRGDEQGDHREQRHLEKERQRDRQAQLHQTFDHLHVRLAETRFVTDITHGAGALHIGEHAEEHHPVNCRCGNAAADAAQFRHAEMTVNKDVVHRNIDQQADKAHHHARFGLRQSFALITHHLEE